MSRLILWCTGLLVLSAWWSGVKDLHCDERFKILGSMSLDKSIDSIDLIETFRSLNTN